MSVCFYSVFVLFGLPCVIFPSRNFVQYTFLIYLSIYESTALVDLGRFFQFLNPYTVGRTPWTGDRSVARPLTTQRTTQTQNKHTQTSIPRVWFEPANPVLERAKTVHALDRAVFVIGIYWLCHS
jgi:hypothetical protein